MPNLLMSSYIYLEKIYYLILLANFVISHEIKILWNQFLTFVDHLETRSLFDP